MNIGIYIGHGKSDNGGYDSGAVNTRLGLHEFKIAKEIGKFVVEELSKYNVSVELINYDGKLNLPERIKHANSKKYEVIAEIHLNSFSNQSASGVEVYYYTGDNKGKKIADEVSKSISKAMGISQRVNGTDDGGDKPTTYFGFVRQTKPTAILIETLFISNDYEVKKVISSIGQQVMAKSIADAFVKAYNLLLKETSKPVPTPTPTPTPTPPVADSGYDTNEGKGWCIISDNYVTKGQAEKVRDYIKNFDDSLSVQILKKE